MYRVSYNGRCLAEPIIVYTILIGEKMPEKRNRKMVVPAQGGMTRDVINRLKLIFKLMGDPRVSPLVKLIPVGALVYLVSPIDIIMGIPGLAALDDAAILWMGSNLFVELCPPEVVQEYMRAIGSNLGDTSSDDIVDADATDINDQ
jgi:uncharacterized membrane protein YkvA (DUF1232 family)